MALGIDATARQSMTNTAASADAEIVPLSGTQ